MELWIVLIVYVVGLAFVVAEALTPGFIMGLIGMVLIVVSVVFGFDHHWAVGGGQILLAVVVTPAAFVYGMKKIALKTTLEQSSSFAKDLSQYMGLEGETHTELRPAGMILIDGRKVDVVTGGELVEKMILGLPFGPWGILIAIQGFYIIMGVPMDWLGILLITGPVVIPIVKELGFDLIWFGILFDVNMQIAYLSPPVGAAMFYLKSVAPKDISMGDIFRAAIPFAGLQLIGLILIMVFPEIVMWPVRVLVG